MMMMGQREDERERERERQSEIWGKKETREKLGWW